METHSSLTAVLRNTLASVVAELQRFDPQSLVAARAQGVLEVVAPPVDRTGWAKPGPKPKPLTEAEMEAVRLYESGVPAARVAAQANTNMHRVYTLVRRAGGTVRSTGQKIGLVDLDRVERIRAMRAVGKTLEEIGTAEHITRERVRQICVKSGIDTHARALRPEETAAIAAYLAGDSILTAAEVAGINHSTMRNLLVKNGHAIRPVKKVRRRTQKTLIDAERAAQMYSSGVPTQEIADEIGVKQPTVYRLLAIAGSKPDRRPITALEAVSS